MAKIISISSQVSQGFVGNSAIEFALQRLGHEVWSIPSVLLSNHPSYEHYGGIRLKPSMLRPILEGLDMNDFIEEADAIITGYLPTEELVQFAIEAVSIVKAVNPKALFLCDPVFGDDLAGKINQGALYIDEFAARSNKYELLPLADIITPNRYELSWLTDMPVHNLAQAHEAIEKLSNTQILATSIPDGSEIVTNILQTEQDQLKIKLPRHEAVPHGTGDLLSAFYLAEYCTAHDNQKAFAQSVAYVDSLIQNSKNCQELNLVGAQDIWVQAQPVDITCKKQKTKQ